MTFGLGVDLYSNLTGCHCDMGNILVDRREHYLLQGEKHSALHVEC